MGERRLFADTPAQIDRLKPTAMPRAQLPQPREDVLLQGVALLLQVTERRADEDAEGARWLRHGSVGPAGYVAVVNGPGSPWQMKAPQ